MRRFYCWFTGKYFDKLGFRPTYICQCNIQRIGKPRYGGENVLGYIFILTHRLAETCRTYWNCGSLVTEGASACLYRRPCYNLACKSGLSISDSSHTTTSKLKKKCVYIVQYEGSIPSIFNPKIKIRESFDLNRLNVF